MPVPLCVHTGMLQDFLVCVPSVFVNSVGSRAKGKLIFVGKGKVNTKRGLILFSG